jgi:hypothetical protein
VLKRPFIIYALHLFALCGFAVAQPLYDLLAQNVEFFVAHRVGAGEVLLFVVAISFGVPLVLISLLAIIGLASSRARQVLHLVFVAVLISAGVLIAFNRFPGFPVSMAVGLSLAASLIVTGLYARSQVLQRFCTVASAFALIFPIHLIAFTPVSGIFRSTPEAATSANIEASTPIVFVLFDEFNLTGLLNERQEIDAVRFPNFAGLADNAWWFRRATSVYPATIKAVPAILTGVTPTQDITPPSAAGYPNNLFTWLGSSYRLNVAETATELCPRNLCGEANGQPKSRVDWGLLASDLSIVYLHALLPVRYASTLLPPIDTGWNGFAVSKPSPSRIDEVGSGEGRREVHRGTTSRADAFSAFVSRVDGGDKSLDFLHILLPHSPYVYLPNGQAYLGGLEEGSLPNLMWADNEYLVRLQYQRFLLQTGYVDKLIGDLVTKLKQTGKYEKSLIIVTADHGKAFRPNVSKRTLGEDNAADILQIPLFIKLPGQSDGKISDRPVSNLDILPTIADVIAAKVPWKLDGQSMVGETFPDRDVLEMRTRQGPDGNFTFDRKMVTAFPRLPWQMSVFGAGSPLTSLRLRGEHFDLVGNDVSNLPVDRQQEQISVSLEALDALNRVDLSAEALPVYWRGEIQGLNESEKDLSLALALNGKIEAVVSLYSWNDKRFQYSALIPQTALKGGKNEFRAFLVRQDGMSRRITELMARAPRDEFVMSKGNGNSEAIVSASGRRIQIAPGKVDGWADHLKYSEFLLEISGWSVETDRKVPAAEILIFTGDKFIYAGSPNTERRDVSKALGVPGLTRSGYHFRIPLKTWDKEHSTIRVFGVTKEGIASELAFSPQAREAVAGIQ